MKEKTIFGIMAVLLLFLMTIGVASADTPSTRVVLAVGGEERLTIDGSVGMTLDSVYYVPGAIDNGANIIFSVKNSVNDVVPVAKFMAQGTKLQFNGLTFYVERVGETSIILEYGYGSVGPDVVEIPITSVTNPSRTISTEPTTMTYQGALVANGCELIEATKNFLNKEEISFSIISSKDLPSKNFEDLFSNDNAKRSINLAECVAKGKVLPPFNVAIANDAPQSDVMLTTNYLAYLQGIYGTKSVESDYVVNILPIGVAVLFDEFDFSKVDSQITVVIYNDEAVIVVGQNTLPVFIANSGKDVLINPSGLEGDYACAPGCKEVEDGCLCPKIRITKKSGQGFEIASSTSASVVAKEIRIQPGSDYIEAVSANSIPSVRIGNSDLAEGMAIDVAGYKNVFVSTNKNSLETYLKEGQISIKTRETLINDENGISVETSSGNKELKILPTVASEKAKEVLSDKYSELELKEVGNKIVYVSNEDKQYKIFGFIPASSKVTAQIDAETGETQVSNPWYAGISVETK
ncbi:hypothetical protein COV13_03920 [Candidatus Woesearchaeota archaeon CG10_big_fil_rev_8_21_14_0_10_32_9]|nr:MAG: hypothetical protein COV13_03920 [Candidatus Woesearchaeota archaeon CG10_big_fil_rev_8_21_14_0_10_32_9]